ncbi:MAG: alpha/beta hydrolase family protein [Salibacteraceae bacterium]
MKTIKDKIEGKYKTISLDLQFQEITNKKLIPVILVHGFKGYKDWGAFNLIAENLASSGFFVLKFNFSHNGTTSEHLTEFVDLNAFGLNNISRELEDLNSILDYFESEWKDWVDLEELSLIAHSRGGATSILKASTDSRIKKMVTWASVGTIEKRIPQISLEEFKRTNVIYQLNGRTGQQMPIFYQFVEDFYDNIDRYALIKSASKLDIPVCIIHGTNDATVSVREAEALKKAIPNSELFLIEDGDHSFGQAEPWLSKTMPEQLSLVVEKTISFLKPKT